MTFDDLVVLQQQLILAGTVSAKNAVLTASPAVRKLLGKSSGFSRFLKASSPEVQCALTQLAAIGQGLDVDEESLDRWRQLAKTSLEIDRFYREIGGIVGYQVSILQLLQKTEARSHPSEKFHSPVFDDISMPTEEVLEWIREGLHSLPMLAELYPLGGAADRLHLVDAETGLELPAAKLQFAGRTLLETLLRDLAAREWLYFRLFGKQITTPVAIMTSCEKDNHRHVLTICEENGWFGRPQESFRLFSQPLVPAVDEQGNWYTTAPCRPVLKPGGHGAVWKLARDEGVFAWLKSLGCKKALVRQINNPMAGLDYGLLAFLGIGAVKDMSFGFASCCRRVSSAEGIVVLKEAEGRMGLTNIEYCDFLKKGIRDEPVLPGGQYSRFSSNTNILFADLEAVEKAVDSHPFPGLLMNLKSAQLVSDSGISRQVMLARLESTMQNIADAFEEPKQAGLETKKTFVTYNLRHKTISVAKKAYILGKSLLETPECCFYELLQAARELLSHCGFALPPMYSLEEAMERGPDCAFFYHPALGPLYSIIQQKLRGGKLTSGSELFIEVAELDAENVAVDGSLRIMAEQVLGEKDEGGVLHYSNRVGQCFLRNITVVNQGVDWTRSAPFWTMSLQRKESLAIILKGKSIFDAKDVVFTGNQRFVVEDGMQMTVRQIDGEMSICEEPISQTGEASERMLWDYGWEKGVKLVRNS